MRSTKEAASVASETRDDVEVLDAARVATVFRVLGDASRCRLIYALLRRDEICVGELADQLGMSESNVSHHLSVLRAHGLVRFRRAGKQVFYAPDDDHIRLLLDMTLEHVRHGVETGDGGRGVTVPAARDAAGGRPGRP
jgi:ArsR family transcriptional regulator, lead/cadmium/zinc/bismuth-responsive transcriptional repressor